MDETWSTRELPVLQSLVEYYDDPSVRPYLTWHQVAGLAGIDPDGCKRALAKLASADPPFVEPVNVGQEAFPIGVTGVTERALFAVGQWPSGDAAEELDCALARLEESECDPERKGRLRRLREAVGDAGKDIVARIAAELIKSTVPLP